MVTKRTVKQTTTDKLAWRFEQLAKPIPYRDADSKYVGDEPAYPTLEEQTAWTDSQYRTQVMRSLNWYAHTQDKKKSLEWLVQFLAKNPRRAKLAEAVKRGDIWPGATVGFALRAGRVGLNLRFGTLKTLLKQLKQADVGIDTSAQVVEEVKEVKSKFNIQERMAEKTSEFLGEVEGRFDDFITEGQFKGEPKLVELMTQMNVPQQQLKTVQEFINSKIAEFEEIIATTDGQTLEAYKHLGKRQLTAIVKWWQQALSDANSYNVVKKAAKAPRKKKAVLPEKVVAKLKYAKEFKELALKSVDPTAILTAQELWVYNTKTRKLGIYIADQYAGALTVKNSSIVGFDANASVQKTLRKPKDQLKEFSANGKPAAKKWFKGVRSTEIKLNGRIGLDIILLKVYK
jgi:hypothetical protein